MNASDMEADGCSIPGLAPWREKRGLSQTELADLVGVSRGTIGRYESGWRHVSVPRLKQLAFALECTPNDLLTAPSYSDSETSGTVAE